MTGSDQNDSLPAYRLVAPKWADSALSGEGARLYGGRWNSPGRPMVYLSTSRALAALELLVHLTTPASRRIPRTLVTVTVPRELIDGELNRDEGWRNNPPGPPSVRPGDEWLATGKAAGVLVPSALIPEEDNLLLNPLHPDFQKVEVARTASFFFDPRLSNL